MHHELCTSVDSYSGIVMAVPAKIVCVQTSSAGYGESSVYGQSGYDEYAQQTGGSAGQKRSNPYQQVFFSHRPQPTTCFEVAYNVYVDNLSKVGAL